MCVRGSRHSVLQASFPQSRHSGDSVSLSPLPEWQQTCADRDKESSGAADCHSVISFAVPFLSVSCRTALQHGCAGLVWCSSGSWVGQLGREWSEGLRVLYWRKLAKL